MKDKTKTVKCPNCRSTYSVAKNCESYKCLSCNTETIIKEYKDYEVGTEQTIDAFGGFELCGTIQSKKCITCAKMSILKVTSFSDKTPLYCMNGCEIAEFMDFEEEDRVIVRSNEDDPIMVGTITSFDMQGRETPSNQDLPFVKSDADGKVYMCMGLVFAYTDALMEEIKDLTPKEQWNYLSSNYKRY